MVAFGFLGQGLAADSPFALLCQPLRPWMGALHGWGRYGGGGGGLGIWVHTLGMSLGLSLRICVP